MINGGGVAAQLADFLLHCHVAHQCKHSSMCWDAYVLPGQAYSCACSNLRCCASTVYVACKVYSNIEVTVLSGSLDARHATCKVQANVHAMLSPVTTTETAHATLTAQAIRESADSST